MSQQQPNDGFQTDYQDDYDDSVLENLQNHLDNLPKELKTYLVKNLDPKSINILGIVNGQEVYDYFYQIYTSQLAPLKGNSAQSKSMNPGSPPAQMAQSQQQL